MVKLLLQDSLVPAPIWQILKQGQCDIMKIWIAYFTTPKIDQDPPTHPGYFLPVFVFRPFSRKTPKCSFANSTNFHEVDSCRDTNTPGLEWAYLDESRMMVRGVSESEGC